MATSSLSRVRVVAALTVLTSAVLLCASCGGSAPVRRPVPRPPQPVLSRYETQTGREIVRDCGFSAVLPAAPGQSLWLFCDTEITSRQGDEIGLPILGTGTAAEGPYRAGSAPSALTEVPTPGAAGVAALPGTPGLAPQPFLTTPTGLTLPATNLPCAGANVYPARWFTGAGREPGSTHLLISYVDYCVSGSYVFTPEAFGLLDYDPAANVLGSPAQVFTTTPGEQLLPAWVLGSPVFAGGYLYLYSSCAPGSGCGAPGVFLVRTLASAADWQNEFSYQYWTGQGWSSSPYSAMPLRAAGTPVGLWAGDFSATGHGLVLIEQTRLSGEFTVWQASAPTGPWHRVTTGRVPCRAGRRSDPNGLCRALIGHPELSTRAELLISFFNPGTDHVEVSAFPW